MKFHIYETVEELLHAYAHFFAEQAEKYSQENGRFNVALSGGSSPKRVYELLASPGFREKIPWQNVYFFFGDERHVPADDARNNALMVEKALFGPLQIAADHVFKMNTALLPNDCAADYMKTIAAHFQPGKIKFDLILLGLGDNAHTASLFPHTPLTDEKKATVSEVYLKEEDAYRITLTAPLINQAKQIAFLVFGKYKAEALQQVVYGERNPDEFPAQLIQPEAGELHWFLDRAVASLL